MSSEIAKSSSVAEQACSDYEAIAKLAGATLSSALPPIVYPPGRSSSRFLASDVLDHRFSNVGDGSRLEIVAAVFEQDGPFLGMVAIEEVLRVTCPGLPRNIFRYGVSYK